MKNKNPIWSQSGFSLIETLTGMAVFVICFLLSVQSFWQAQNSLRMQEQTITRIRLFQSLIQTMGMAASVRSTVRDMGDTSYLGQCVGAYTCPSPELLRDISIRLPMVYATGSGIGLSGVVSGPPSAPVLYNGEGVACDPATDTCNPDEYYIGVSTQYDLICGPLYDAGTTQAPLYSGPLTLAAITPVTGSCGRAHYIRLYYKFEYVGSPTASQIAFAPVTGTILVNVAEIGLAR